MNASSSAFSAITALGITRRLARAIVPPHMRQLVRTIVKELPLIARDALDRSVPGPLLRYNVAGTTSREQFLEVGRRGAAEIIAALPRPIGEEDVVLDLGCGCGRIARHFGFVKNLYGVDVDARAIRWCRRHLHGTYDVRIDAPPGIAFTLIYAVSIFTHLDEAAQDEALASIHRALARGGLLVVTLHNPEHVRVRGTELNREGFAFVAGNGPFNENSAFHDVRYLRSHWSRWFELVNHIPFGFVAFHDLAVFRKL
jgi:SAM-dependent methyltransferase